MKDLQRQRHKETLATTFNKLGIVVPYDKKTELGYRPLPMSDSKLGVDGGGGVATIWPIFQLYNSFQHITGKSKSYTTD